MLDTVNALSFKNTIRIYQPIVENRSFMRVNKVLCIYHKTIFAFKRRVTSNNCNQIQLQIIRTRFDEDF